MRALIAGFAIAACSIALIGSPAIASASLSWSAPLGVNTAGGQKVEHIACPSTTQCTALDEVGREVTFDPTAPGKPTPLSIDTFWHSPSSIACPSTSRCTAVDRLGGAVTFDPSAPGTPSVAYTGTNNLQDVACPSTSQCTAIGEKEVTFNPADPEHGTAASTGLGFAVSGIACPSTTQCTAVDTEGKQVTFDPTAPGTPTPTTIDAGAYLLAVACPSTSQCTAVDANGAKEVTFNPASPGTPTPVSLGLGGASSIGCPSTTQCTAVGFGEEVTFNPTAPGTPKAARIDNFQAERIACPSTSECAAGDAFGGEVAFNPAAPGTPTRSTIAGPGRLAAVSCPSSLQCTAISSGEQEMTFNPASPGTPALQTIDSGFFLDAVACPSAAQCTAVDSNGREVTFNPSAPGTPIPASIGLFLEAIACPSTSQCTAVGPENPGNPEGKQVTFNPASPGSPVATTVDSSAALRGLACPSTTQCTGVDSKGREVTFNPTSPGTPTPATLSGITFLTAIACPATSQCTAVGNGKEPFEEDAVTFNPLSPGTPTLIRIEGPFEVFKNPLESGLPQLGFSAVACPSTSECVVAERNGHTAQGNPSSTQPWIPERVNGAYRLSDLACPTTSSCVAVDELSNVFIGVPGTSHSLTVSLAGAGGGSVTGSGISCPSTCSASYPSGTPVTLSATPATGSSFSGWAGGGCSGTGTCTVTMSSDQSVTATYAVTSSGGSGGGGGSTSGGSTSGGSSSSASSSGGGSSGGSTGGVLANSAHSGAVAGHSEEAAPVSGTVLIRRPGAHGFTPLTITTLIPDGSELDATNGKIVLLVASGVAGVTNSVELYGGRFIIHQTTGASPVTTFALSLPLTGCRPTIGPARIASAAASAGTARAKRKKGPRSRHLWVTEHGGNFNTQGQYVSTSVQGTTWLTSDECTSSRVTVAQGVVKVRDLVRRRTVTVRTGGSYTARKHH